MKKPKTKSARQDGRGGWTPGKRRHADVGDWARLRTQLAAMLSNHYSRGTDGRNNVAVAAACGVGERSVRRWLSGEDWPSPAAQKAVKRWLAKQQKKVQK